MADNAYNDGRIHGAVFHKCDNRMKEILRQCCKSDIISLFNVECYMLFDVKAAHSYFDNLHNFRPYIVFDGTATGVFIPYAEGLLFPNGCDQLDFRPDFEVESKVTYGLSDIEISMLAQNGLFNGDWSYQGRIIGSTLEIPCKIDYYAIANTPVTFIEIQDRLGIRTSTSKTGYRSLVAAFLPYAAQRHTDDRKARIIEADSYNLAGSEIRKRGLFDSKTRELESEPYVPEHGASFVEIARKKIRDKLNEGMSKGDILGTRPRSGDGNQMIMSTVSMIEKETSEARKRAEKQAADIGTAIEPSVIDARLNDMEKRMVYASANSIPIEMHETPVTTYAPPKAKGVNDKIMERPITEVSLEGMGHVIGKEKVVEADDRLRDNVLGARESVSEIVDAVNKTKSRQEVRAEMMAKRKAELAARTNALQRTMQDAAGAEESEGLTSREPDAVTRLVDEDTGEVTEESKRADDVPSLDGDVISGIARIDDIVNEFGG